MPHRQDLSTFQHGEQSVATRPAESRGMVCGEASVVAVPGPNSRASLAFERWLLGRLLQALGRLPIAIRLWDGHLVTGAEHPVRHEVCIHDRATLWKVLVRPDFELAEGYVAGRIDSSSPLTELLTAHFSAWKRRKFYRRPTRLTEWRRSWHRSLRWAPRNIKHHYDLGNDFYRLWLDEQLLYTCAYFRSPNVSLEQAQVAKMDHICRKVQLKAGDRVIEAGCGWGAFALHMARHYGARVTAYNISREQIGYARRQAAVQGLENQVEFVADDWRHIQGECDVFVSVGMLEHVGPENYRELGGVINRCLLPSGRGLIHSIGLNQSQPLDSWVEQRIFPGAQPPTLREAMEIFEPYDFSVLDIENLRLHYVRTLREWLRRFEAAEVEVRRMFDDSFVRMWRMYLAASIASFETGWLQLFQILFAPAANNDLQLTRKHLEVPDTSYKAN